MTFFEEIFHRLKEMGFSYYESIGIHLDRFVADARERAPFSSEEADVTKAIVVSKASDISLIRALSSERNTGHMTNVTEQEVEEAKRFCIPFLFCWPSTVLRNKKVTASVLTSADSQILQDIGISTNEELAKTPDDTIMYRILSHFKKSSPAEIDPHFFELLKRRIAIWKMEAELLSKHQSAYKDTYT